MILEGGKQPDIKQVEYVNLVKRMVLHVLAKSFPAQSKHEMSRPE